MVDIKRARHADSNQKTEQASSNKRTSRNEPASTLDKFRRQKLSHPKLRVSIGTLMELEKWVGRACVGKTRRAFVQIINQVKCNGDDLYDTIHSLTLAQIMPYQEIKRLLMLHNLNPARDDFELVCDLAKRYNTSRDNVVERICHVRSISRFLDDEDKNAQ